MKNTFLLLLSIIALEIAYSQEQSVFKDKTFDYFTTDILGNIYVWSNSTLEKYSSEGMIIAQYKNPSWGQITHVDASIPSKIMVFYQDSGVILFLDDKAIPIGNPLHLFDKNLFSVSLVSLLGTENIVLFDNSTQNLLITDLNVNIKHSTPCNFAPDFSPHFLITELDKRILLVDSTMGLYFFDKYGSFEKKIAFIGINYSQLQKDNLYYLKNNRFYQYNLFSMEESTLFPNINNIKEFQLFSDFILILDNTGHIRKISTKGSNHSL